MAREKLAWAKADLELLKAGAWELDKLLAAADVAQAEVVKDQSVRGPLSRYQEGRGGWKSSWGELSCRDVILHTP